MLSFAAKAWWTLLQYRLSATKGGNILSPDRASLVVGIMEGYEIDEAKLIVRKIHDQVLSIYTTLAFQCLLIMICLEEGVQEIAGVY